MNGQRIPRTPIVVDYWNLGKIPPRCLFFLTHMHADHTSGLNASWPYPIHCTSVTGKLLIRKFKIDPKLLVELEVGESKMLHVDRWGSHVTITVTTIDANHCPGSAMFLFEGYFGRILYTGDFRFCPSMLDNPPLNGSRSIDVLYLDNTYCDPSCNFPTREEATKTLVSLIKEKRDQYKTVIIGLHTLGKEELLVELATSLQQWVGVSSERMTTLRLLEFPNVFTTDMSGSFFQVHPFYLVAKNRLAEMSSEDVLAVLPTCLYSGRGALPQPAGVVVVPYSDHSSFEELKSFVKAMRPRCVKPIVKSFSGDRSYISALRGDMSVFNEYLDPSSPHEYHMPTGTEDLANSSQISYSSPLLGPILTPTVRRSHSYSSGSKVQLRSRSRGVRFLSPAKSKSPEMLEIDNSSHSNDEHSSQPKNLDDTRQGTLFNGDDSDNNGVTIGSAAPFSKSSDRIPFINLTFSEQRFGISENSLQSSHCNQPISLLAQVEPANGPAASQLKMNQTGKSIDGATFVQTKLVTFTNGKLNTDSTTTSTIVRSLSGRRSLPAFPLSLEEPVTCARVVPIESLKLGRYGHIKKDENRDELEGGGCQKTVEDIEDSNDATHETELVDKTAVKVPVLSGSYQDSVVHVREKITDETKAGDEPDSDTCTSSPSTCAKLVPIECVKLSRSGHGGKEKDGGRDGPMTMEGDGYQKGIKDAEDSNRSMSQKIEPIDKTATLVPVLNKDGIAFVQSCKICAGPGTVESMETEGSSLANAQTTNTEVIDLAHLDGSQSLSPKSPESNSSTLPPGKFQNGNSSLQSTEQSTSPTAAIAEGSSNHHSGQGSSPRNAESANILTPLPKLGSPKATDALYGKEPSRRSHNSGSSVKRKLLRPPLTFLNDTPSSSTIGSSYSNNCSLSNFLQAPTSKRLKLSTGKDDQTGAQTTATAAMAKSRRVLPAYLQPDAMSKQNHFGNNFNHSCDGYSQGQVDASVGVCVCGCSETQPVHMCGQCHSSIIKVNRSGLFERLSKLDLSSPEICQVIHNALDTVAVCQEKSTATPCRKTSLLRCTCEDEEATKCFSGLGEYVSDSHSQSSKNNTSFDNWVIKIDT